MEIMNLNRQMFVPKRRVFLLIGNKNYGIRRTYEGFGGFLDIGETE